MMVNLTYKQMLDENDIAVSELKAIYQLPEVARYLNISDNYFCYVTKTSGVYFYKVYNKDELIGAIHLELNGNLLYMDILIFPKFQRKGFATKVIEDIQNDIFKLNYNKIEIAVDETNSASLKLFENAGFTRTSKDDELINLVYQKTN
ncbi:MAG: GNAT family N-acetyltransferase [Ruminococcaceae bacterium]|nr:GNAT family N-acetyltransferase [Oscillospiraceae bacterium]